jgi:hypothetical protein
MIGYTRLNPRLIDMKNKPVMYVIVISEEWGDRESLPGAYHSKRKADNEANRLKLQAGEDLNKGTYIEVVEVKVMDKPKQLDKVDI